MDKQWISWWFDAVDAVDVVDVVDVVDGVIRPGAGWRSGGRVSARR